MYNERSNQGSKVSNVVIDALEGSNQRPTVWSPPILHGTPGRHSLESIAWFWHKAGDCAVLIILRSPHLRQSQTIDKGVELERWVKTAPSGDKMNSSRRRSPKPEQVMLKVLEAKWNTVNTVILICSSAAWSPMTLDLNEAKRHVKSIHITSAPSRMA